MSNLSTLEANSLKGALEALLLVSSDPVSAPALAGALDMAPGESASLLAGLKGEYEGSSCARSPAAGACLRTPLTTTWSRPMC